MARKLNITLDETEMNLLAKILAGGSDEGGEPTNSEPLQDRIFRAHASYTASPGMPKRESFLDAIEEIHPHGTSLADVLDMILPKNVEYLELGLFLSIWSRMCSRYVSEADRFDHLTPGECLRACASAINLSLRNRAFEMGSPHGTQYDPLGAVLSSISGLLFRLASYHGCERAPIIPWGTDTGTGAWSQAGG